MKRIIYISRYSILSILLLACSCYAWAQNGVSFTAAASANKMGVQDQIQFTYTITDAENLRAVSPSGGGFKDFDVLGGPYQSTSTNMSIINGHMTQSESISLTYVLKPKHTGNLSIPAGIAKDAAGHVYQSNAVPVQVVAGSVARNQRQQSMMGDPMDDPFAAMQQRQMQRMQQMQRQMQQAQQPQQQSPANAPINSSDINKDLFIKVTVDKNKVHVGEQITTSYKLYARIPMQIGISKLPSLNGFWTQDFDIPKGNIKPQEEVVNGKKYQVFLLKKSALFPQQAGTLELDPAEAQGVARIIQQVRQRNPFADMFDDPAFQNAFGSLMMNDPVFNNGFFNAMAYKDVPVHLRSTPIKIEVLPLPEKNKPADFGGAVGNFNISANIDKKDFTSDDVASLTVTITGSGNLKLIEAPKLKLPNGLESYDPIIKDTVTGRSTTISGSKILTYAITPQTPGDYDIPAIPFSYFNPQTGSYVSLSTQPIKIHVKQGKNYKPSANNYAALTDIHNIDTKPLPKLSFSSKPLLFKPAYWSMYGFPLLAFMGLLVWRRREDELSKDTVLLRSRRANKIALKRLVTAQKLLQQNNEKPFYEEISKAIWLYLSDKLNIPLSSLSRESAAGALQGRNIPAALLQKIEQVMTDCETALYANGGKQQMNRTYNDAVDVISELEETI
ncbi:MAG: protein BatD [Bacteroidetes bacterium]|nr:protein BatD [Bacteroidota bacterium]